MFCHVCERLSGLHTKELGIGICVIRRVHFQVKGYFLWDYIFAGHPPRVNLGLFKCSIKLFYLDNFPTLCFLRIYKAYLGEVASINIRY